MFLNVAIILGLLLVAFVLFLKLSANSFGKKERDEYARQLGMEVESVRKDVLTGGGVYAGSPKKKESMQVTKYILKCNAKYKNLWGLRQVLPDKKVDAQGEFGKWSKLDESDGKIKPSIKKVLLDFVESFDDGYFEIEKDGTSINLFWEEQGGKVIIDNLYGILNHIKELEEAA